MATLRPPQTPNALRVCLLKVESLLLRCPSYTTSLSAPRAGGRRCAKPCKDANEEKRAAFFFSAPSFDDPASRSLLSFPKAALRLLTPAATLAYGQVLRTSAMAAITSWLCTRESRLGRKAGPVQNSIFLEMPLRHSVEGPAAGCSSGRRL